MSYRKRLFITGMTTACAGFIALAVFVQYLDTQRLEYPPTPVPVFDAPQEPQADLKMHLQEPPAASPSDKRKPAHIAPQQPAAEPEVAGIREALRRAAGGKREASAAVDAINSEDIGKFPDTNLAESAQRISGVAVQQDEEVVVFGIRGTLDADADSSRSTQAGVAKAGDRFQEFKINPVKLVSKEPVSTFSVDVDTASYSFVRRRLNAGVLPDKDEVRIEELINYFDYQYPVPQHKKEPFASFVTVSDSPWAKGKRLLHIGIKGYELQPAQKPRANLVFLMDVSGSMDEPDKLPLVKQSLHLLLDSLAPEDTVAIVVYAGAAGVVLEPTRVRDKQKILASLDRLQAGGSTAGAEGIELAYQLAASNFDKKAVNRVILATDGDFNVGIDEPRKLQNFIERKRDKGIFLSVLGFGEGNYHDHMMQSLAQSGNGVAAYIDTLSEAQKVLVDEAGSTLFPIAKDVKIQVEFNPASVAEYRLIGYETRHLEQEDFNNDAIDAGDIGAGHAVTAIYEITPVDSDARLIDKSRYPGNEKPAADSGKAREYAFLKIRYKLPDQNTSRLITQPIGPEHDLAANKHPGWMSQETGFAAAVAGFAQLLKGGEYTGELNYDAVIALAEQTKGTDKYGYRAEFIQLVRKTKTAAALRK